MTKKINPATIKALAIDLDGTMLLPDNSLGERTTKCLKHLQVRGIQVIICTGRAVESCRRYYSAIDAQGPMVFFNGAEVVDVPAIRLISASLLGFDVIDYGIDLARSMGIHFQVFLPPQDNPNGETRWETLLFERDGEEGQMYKSHTGIRPLTGDLKAAITKAAATGLQGCPKAMFISDGGLHEEIRQKMLGRFPDRLYIANTFPTFLEIMAAGVSKGEGLKTVMACRGLKPQEVIAFGDEENDLPMFAAAGFSAAPSSAKESVRRAADFVFASNAEEGLAAFLEESFG